MALDFGQGVLVMHHGLYFLFFYIPEGRSLPPSFSLGLDSLFRRIRHIFRPRSFFASIVNRSRDVRVLFGRMGIFLALSGCVDALYYYGPAA